MTAQADGIGRNLRDSVMELTLAEAPGNPLTHSLRRALDAALAEAIADPAVRGIVLRGGGGVFSTGTDPALADPGWPLREEAPRLSDLCRRIEDSPKCVVALIEGAARGAGVELALAAHWRLAAPTAQFSFPDAALGLIPCGGATQRLPRLVSGTAAVRLLVAEPDAGGGAGHTVDGTEAAALGLVDAVPGTARDLAAHELALTAPARRTADAVPGGRDALGYQQAIARARAGLNADDRRGPSLAAVRTLDCLEAAQLLSFPQGLAFEAQAFAELAARPETSGRIHARLAELRAMALPVPAGADPDRLAVLGTAPEALALTAQAVAAGLAVTLIEPDRNRLVAALEQVASLQEGDVAAGRLGAEAREAAWARLTPTLRPDAAREGAAAVFGTLGEGLAADLPAVLLGPLDARAGGLALWPAAGPGRLAELAIGGAADRDLIATVAAVAARLGWRLVVTGPGGPVETRLRGALAAAVMAEERAGHTPAVIVAALAGYGIGTPPGVELPVPGAEGEAIVAHCLLALINEGARMLGQGTVRCPAVVDAVAVGSGLFPRSRGGPMYQADQRGLMMVRAGLSALAAAEPALYTPAPFLDALVRKGGTFGDLDR